MSTDRTMKKSGFIRGAMIVTLGIVITKILGILYVIPFHAIIGDDGGTLYGYAYTIYLVFMSLSSLGIPLSISKIVSEYQAQGYYKAKRRTFYIGKKIALILGVVCFLILFICAPIFSKLILGNLSGGNSLDDVTLVIRAISFAILIVPVLSIYRGYFEGHRFMQPPSFSQVIEQLVRVFIIIVGTFLALKIFKLPLSWSIALAVFGAFLGALFSFIYLFFKLNKNKVRFNERVRDVNEPIISDKAIMKKIIYYSLPFIFIDVFKSLYSYVDMVTVIKGLNKYAYFTVSDSETIMSMLSTWGAKFNMILIPISTGIVVSLIPNLSKNFVKKDKKDISNKINQSLSLLLFLTVPMTIGISFLSTPIWNLFYGASKYGPSVLTYLIFTGFFMGLFTLVVSIVQSFKNNRVIFYSLFIGFLLKVFLNTNLISAFYKIGIPAYYGVITASIIGYAVVILICLVVLHFKYKVNYEQVTKNTIDILCGTFLMSFILFLMKLIIPLSSESRFVSLIIILVYSIIGIVIYLLFAYRCGLLRSVFGSKLNKYIRKDK